MPASDVTAVSHIGLCVSDYDKSLRFYTEGLGFEVAEGWDISSDMAPLAEVPPPIAVRSQMLVKGPVKLELLGWRSPLAEGSALRSRREIGFTHLSLFVADLAAVEARLQALGGTVLEHTRLHIPAEGGGATDVVFLADPDGIRIELTQHAPAYATQALSWPAR
jgi:lactoylglutathione lyase